MKIRYKISVNVKDKIKKILNIVLLVSYWTNCRTVSWSRKKNPWKTIPLSPEAWTCLLDTVSVQIVSHGEVMTGILARVLVRRPLWRRRTASPWRPSFIPAASSPCLTLTQRTRRLENLHKQFYNRLRVRLLYGNSLAELEPAGANLSWIWAGLISPVPTGARFLLSEGNEYQIFFKETLQKRKQPRLTQAVFWIRTFFSGSGSDFFMGSGSGSATNPDLIKYK